MMGYRLMASTLYGEFTELNCQGSLMTQQEAITGRGKVQSAECRALMTMAREIRNGVHEEPQYILRIYSKKNTL